MATMSDAVSTKNEKREVTEGKATIVTPNNVFYNPVQEFNRDLTIAVISLQARQHFQAHHKATNVTLLFIKYLILITNMYKFLSFHGRCMPLLPI